MKCVKALSKHNTLVLTHLLDFHNVPESTEELPSKKSLSQLPSPTTSIVIEKPMIMVSMFAKTSKSICALTKLFKGI